MLFYPSYEDEMESTWDILLSDWFSRPLPTTTRRRTRPSALPGKADAVFGMRRSGKTSLLLGELADRVERGLPRERALYLSLEDERLAGLEAAGLGGMLEAWWRRYPSVAGQECWLILDEVQEVPGWEKFVRRLIDRGGIRLAVTGSSAKLLSREIATSLRGRCVPLELLPFSLDEVLAHAGTAVHGPWPPPEAGRAALQQALDRYLEVGGFPEVVGLDGPSRVQMLRNYVDVVLFRDVVERHGATNIPALRRIVRRLVSAPATQLSVHRFHNDLKSAGVTVGKDTLYAYIEHVEDACLAFRVPMWTESERVRSANPPKTYVVDPGLAHAWSARPQPGHQLENVVYLELRRRGGDIAWMRTKSGFEVDFVISGHQGVSLVQACYELHEPETRARELRALSEAMAETGIREATIVTRLESEEIQLSSGVVHVVPAWAWLLNFGR